MSNELKPTVEGQLSKWIEETRAAVSTVEHEIRSHEQTFIELNRLEGVELDFCHDGQITVRVKGGAAEFRKAWKMLRIAGYHPSARPGDQPASQFSCFWWNKDEKDRYAIFFIFSSKVCIRKKVGERTVTTTEEIWELDCGAEKLVIESDLGELL